MLSDDAMFGISWLILLLCHLHFNGGHGTVVFCPANATEAVNPSVFYMISVSSPAKAELKMISFSSFFSAQAMIG